MPLWRCSWLYQRTNRLAQLRAASRSANPLVGNSGRYLAVRNNASANALSSLTRGREWDGAMPVQHGEHGGALQGGAVVSVQHRARRHGMDALGQGGALGQVRGMLGAVAVVHLEADDFAAVEIQDEVQVEPAALHLRRQEGHVPAPDLPWAGGHVRARRRRGPGWARPPAAVHLAVVAQHP